MREILKIQIKDLSKLLKDKKIKINIDKKIKKGLNISKFSKCVYYKGYIPEKDTHSYIFSSQLLLMVESINNVMSYVIPVTSNSEK